MCLYFWILLCQVAIGQTSYHFQALCGTWEYGAASGGRVIEAWEAIGPERMEGRNFLQTPENEEILQETLRLQRSGGVWVLLATPVSGRPTPFALDTSASEPYHWVFRNPAHDFPRRIVYDRREAGKLIAWIDDGDDATEDGILFRFEAFTDD